MSAKLAVYAGTFDPITNGHKDIIERATKIFDSIIVAVVEGSSKQTLFSAEERRGMIEGAIQGMGPQVSVRSFDGLLVDFVKSVGSKVIIRGLRAVSDYEYEAQMAIINRQISEEIETVFLMTSKRSSFISSSIVRQIAKYQGDITSLVPENVAAVLQERFRKNN